MVICSPEHLTTLRSKTMSLRRSPTRTAAMLAANRSNAQKSTGSDTAVISGTSGRWLRPVQDGTRQVASRAVDRRTSERPTQRMRTCRTGLPGQFQLVPRQGRPCTYDAHRAQPDASREAKPIAPPPPLSIFAKTKLRSPLASMTSSKNEAKTKLKTPHLDDIRLPWFRSKPFRISKAIRAQNSKSR
jgi:hypothetical protein